MEDKRRAARSYRIIPLVAAMMLVVLLAGACKGATVSSGSGSKSDVALSFRVLGGAAASASLSSKAISGLILPSASKLTVSLTPVDSGLPTPDSQTVAISSTGASTVSVTFSDLELGEYAVKAVASDSSGAAQFQQSATLTVSESSTSATLNLVPVITSSSPSYSGGTGGSFSVGTIAAGAMVACEIPAEAFPNGWYYPIFNMDSLVGFDFYAQAADGTLLMHGILDSGGGITVDGTAVSYPQVILPSSAPVAYLTLYNPDTANDATYVNVYIYPNIP